MIKNKGLTLVELLVGLLIITLLAIFCLPMWQSNYQKNQLQVMENELKTVVHFARNRAILQGQALALSPLPNSTDWAAGMILFVDNKNHEYQTNDKLIHQWQWNHPGLRVVWQGFHSNHYLLFSSELKHAATSGHFDIFVDQGESSRLVVNRLGRITKREEDKTILRVTTLREPYKQKLS